MPPRTEALGGGRAPAPPRGEAGGAGGAAGDWAGAAHSRASAAEALEPHVWERHEEREDDRLRDVPHDVRGALEILRIAPATRTTAEERFVAEPEVVLARARHRLQLVIERCGQPRGSRPLD